MQPLKIKTALSITAAVGLIATGLLVVILSQFDLASSESIDIEFQHEGDSLAGTLLLPEGKEPFPVALFVHGDGAQDRFAGDSYSLVINALLEKGIACFLSDKKGVGKSSGNWLKQSMQSRADEALAALSALEKRNEIDTKKIGYIGFSQAGWVIPKIAAMSDKPAFYIVVGGAINWLQQSEYLTRTRLLSEGFAESDIQLVLSYSGRVNELISSEASYEDYVSFHEKNPAPKGYIANLMNKGRFEFVRVNIVSDVSAEDIQNIKKPLLAIWGEDDLNVDAAMSYSAYKEATENMPSSDVTLLMVERATHGILNSETYNYHLIEQWPTSTKIRYLLEAKDAYAKGYLQTLGDWVNQKLYE